MPPVTGIILRLPVRRTPWENRWDSLSTKEVMNLERLEAHYATLEGEAIDLGDMIAMMGLVVIGMGFLPLAVLALQLSDVEDEMTEVRERIKKLKFTTCGSRAKQKRQYKKQFRVAAQGAAWLRTSTGFKPSSPASPG